MMEKSQCYHPLSYHLMSHVQVFGIKRLRVHVEGVIQQIPQLQYNMLLGLHNFLYLASANSQTRHHNKRRQELYFIPHTEKVYQDLEFGSSSFARHVVSLDKELYSTLSLFTQVYKQGSATCCWGRGVTLGWTSIPSHPIPSTLMHASCMLRRPG